MKCRRCGSQNPLGFSFCGQCGASLVAADADLSKADLDHLRTYLSHTLVEALQLDLLSPTPRLLEQCVSLLSDLCERICALLPAPLVEYVISHPVSGQTGGQFIQGTLLYAGISGFASMSERFGRLGQEGAEEIIAIVDRYFSAMLSVLREHDGQLVTFDGDALLALFSGADSATRGVSAAHRLQEAMADFAETNTSQGFFPLQIKVGLVKRRFFAARVGTQQRMVYALLGGGVNVATAIETAAMAGQIFCDRATLDDIRIPCQTVPSPESERYLVVEQVDLSSSQVPVVETPRWAFTPELTLAGLRQVVELLDALAPYLPTGLLPRLVGEPNVESSDGEYRLVAVLFANVSGLGDIADRLGPRREREISRAVDRYFVAMEQAVHRYGGVINKMALSAHGDKLLAFFGAPLAHEDDAERAVRAALAMQEAMDTLNDELPRHTGLADLRLEQRVGVSYGYVFAGSVGTDWRSEYTVMGDEVSLAAHLLTVAEPGGVTISGNVRRRVQSLFALKPQGEVVVRGRTEPNPAFSVIGPGDGSAYRRGRVGMRSPLVGRQPEWSQLQRSVDQLLLGQGGIVSVIGEAGLGKSRLVAELREFVEGSSVRWIEGRSLSYTEAMSYWPFQDILRQMLGLEPEDTGQAAQQKLQDTLEETPSVPDVGAILPYLSTFLGLPVEDLLRERIRYLDAEALLRRTYIAISILFESFARTGSAPVIVVLEDIHWIDQVSLDLLEHLLFLVDRVPLMLLLTYRPEHTQRCWQLHEQIAQGYAHCWQEIDLNPLGPSDSQKLLSNLVHIETWPGKMRDTILDRADGNPLYLEEMLRALIGDRALIQDGDGQWRISGRAEQMRVPDTLQGVIMTRLDRIDESSRWTAQVASVIGRVFTIDVLDHVMPLGEAQLRRNLAELQEHEIIHQSQSQSTPHPAYDFSHVLVQDVCYRSLLTRTRRLYHRRIAGYLSSDLALNRRDAGSSFPVIAYHAFAGEDWPRALRYQLLAGQRARALFANEAAIDHFTRVLQSAEHLPPEQTVEPRRTGLAALGELLTTTGQYDEALVYLQRAQAMAHEQGNKDAEARACRWMARLHELRSEYLVAAERIQEGLIALEGDETVETTQLLLVAGLVNTRLGNYDTALDQCELVLRIAERLGEVAVLARGYTLLGHLSRLQGAGTVAIGYFQRGLDLYEIVGDINGQAIAHDLIATAYFHTGQWQEAERQYLRAREICALIGNTYSLALADNNLGGIALNQGRLDDALEFYERALRSLEKMGESLYVPAALHVNLGHTYIRRGELEIAYQHLDAAKAYYEQAQARDWLPEMYRHFAEAAFLGADLSEAETQARRALELADELSMRNEQGNCLRVLAQIANARGQIQDAREYLDKSISILGQAKDEYECARSVLALAHLSCSQGEVDRCVEALDRCQPVFERLGASLEVAEGNALRETMVRPEG